MKQFLFNSAIATMVALTLCMTSCKNSEMRDLPESGSKLSIDVNIGDMETRAAVTGTKFPSGSELGLFVCAGALGTQYDGNTIANVNAALSGTTWTITPDILLSGTKGTVYGYFPYNAANTNGTSIPINSHTVDYMYATSSNQVDNNNPGAVLDFKHAMTMLEVRVKKGDYTGAASLTEMKVENTSSALIKNNATMNISTGAIAGGTTSTLNWSGLPQTITIAGITHEWILAPLTTDASNSVLFTFTIDGKQSTYQVLPGVTWVAGKRNTYTISFNGSHFVIDDNDISITDWTTGVTENVTIN